MVLRLTGHVMGLSSFFVNIAEDVFGINRDAQESNQAADELKKKMTYCQVNLGKNSTSYQFHGCFFGAVTWPPERDYSKRLGGELLLLVRGCPKTPSLRKWHLGL